MELLTVTVDDVMAWRPGPDWTRERVEALMGVRESFSALDACRCKALSDGDLLWLVLREEMLPAELLRCLAVSFAARVLHLFERLRPLDPRPREALAAALAYVAAPSLSLASNAALAAAWAAAGAAARVAARVAAWAAAGAAASDAAWAWATAGAAARAAAWDAAWAAAGAAAWAAARAAQAEETRRAVEWMAAHAISELREACAAEETTGAQ
jgi:hypothetical protein